MDRPAPRRHGPPRRLHLRHDRITGSAARQAFLTSTGDLAPNLGKARSTPHPDGPARLRQRHGRTWAGLIAAGGRLAPNRDLNPKVCQRRHLPPPGQRQPASSAPCHCPAWSLPGHAARAMPLRRSLEHSPAHRHHRRSTPGPAADRPGPDRNQSLPAPAPALPCGNDDHAAEGFSRNLKAGFLPLIVGSISRCDIDTWPSYHHGKTGFWKISPRTKKSAREEGRGYSGTPIMDLFPPPGRPVLLRE
jgi:hypothetical protein